MASFSIIATGILIILSMIWGKNRTRNVLNPFLFVAAICFLVQVIGPMYWVLEGKTVYRGVEIMAYMPQAELVFCLGYASFWAVFAHTSSKEIKLKGHICYEDKRFLVDFDSNVLYVLFAGFFIIYAIYMVLKGRSLLSQFTLGQMGNYTEDLVSTEDIKVLFFSLGLNAMITCVTLLLFQSKGRIKYIIYIGVLLLAISSGKRHLMLDAVLAPLICYYEVKKKKPNLIIILVGFIVCYLLVGWIGAMRTVYRSGVGTLQAFNNDSAWDAIMINLEVFMPLCMYIPGLNSLNSFSYGTTYILAFIQLIPSFIFPVKNQLISALKIGNANEILGSQFLRDGIAGTFWSGLYSNGWVFGVIIGMGLLGSWIRHLFDKPETGRLTYIVQYSVTTSFLFQLLTRSFGNALQDYIGLMIPLYLLRRIYFSKETK